MSEIGDRAHLDTFLAAVDASSTTLARPVCRGWAGDYQITGKHGHVLADHPGFLLYVTGTARRWKKAKQLLPGSVTQDGDDEGVLRLDRLPAPAEAEAIRDLIGIRRRRHLTAERLSALRAHGVKWQFSAHPCVIPSWALSPPAAALALQAAPPVLQ